jgi:hypothetical protein
MAEPTTPQPKPPDPEKVLALAVDAWKTTVSVQQHFNDLELRIRNFAITFVTAVLGLVGLALKDDPTSLLPVALLLIGLVGWFAFYLMDRWWYHRFLEAAGEHAGRLEKWLSDATQTGPSVFNLSGGIKLRSAIPTRPSFFGRVWKRILKWVYKEETLRSKGRIDAFYAIFAVLSIALAGVFYSQAHRPRTSKPMEVLLRADAPTSVSVTTPPAATPALQPTPASPPAATPVPAVAATPPKPVEVKAQEATGAAVPPAPVPPPPPAAHEAKGAQGAR